MVAPFIKIEKAVTGGLRLLKPFNISIVPIGTFIYACTKKEYILRRFIYIGTINFLAMRKFFALDRILIMGFIARVPIICCTLFLVPIIKSTQRYFWVSC